MNSNKVTSVTTNIANLTNVLSGVTYYINVTAFTTNAESDFSNTLPYIKPLPPTNIIAQ